jgi:DNA-binding MarR family transcriptional regulator
MGEDQRRRFRVTIDLLRDLAANLDALNNAFSPRAGLNRTDLRALDIISRQESLTAGQLAARLKLTTGAITGVLDRLERAGHAIRTHDLEDRRRVVVQPTEEAADESNLVFLDLTQSLEQVLDEYSEEERQVIDGFLSKINRTVSERADQLSSRPSRAQLRQTPQAP